MFILDKYVLSSEVKGELSNNVLYDLGTIYWYFLEDHKTGEEYYRQLIAQYPENNLSASALVTLGEWQPGAQPKAQPKSAGESEVPSEFGLMQNYPNPFNPKTLVKYALPKESHVVIQVYNVLGQMIAILLDAEMPEGYHLVKWNGRSSAGQKVSAGIYLVRMQAGNFVKTQKMMLLP